MSMYSDDSDYESDTTIASTVSSSPNTQDDVVIAVMGATGSGKSTFTGILTGQDVKVSDSLTSETEDVQAVPFLDPTSKQRIIIVDTPGFDDSRDGKTDTEVLKTITQFLLDEYDEHRKLQGLVYVQRISDPRFSGQSKRNLRMFQGLCGTDNFKNIVVLTTFWDHVDEARGVAREGQLKSEFFKDIVAGGGRFMRHDRTVQSAREVLREIIPLPPTHVQIQTDIRKRNLGLADTAAGSVYREEIQHLIEKHKAELTEVKTMMKTVQRHNEEMMRELAEQRAELKAALKRSENEGSALQDGLQDKKQDVPPSTTPLLNIRFVQFDNKVNDDDGSRADQDLVTWKPTLDDGWFYLGPAATNDGYSSPPGVIVQPSGNATVLVPIERWEKVWESRGSATWTYFALWRGVPADKYRLNFTVIGGFFTTSLKPPTTADALGMMAIHNDLLVKVQPGREVWNNSGPKVRLNGAVWDISTHGDLQAIGTGAFVPVDGYNKPPGNTFAIDKHKVNVMALPT